HKRIALNHRISYGLRDRPIPPLYRQRAEVDPQDREQALETKTPGQLAGRFHSCSRDYSMLTP
ncbi:MULTISPECIES: hypothetical protein, partial [unclassified Pseudomonas]|uniref:hypothetical protein n=1 Tax=unclassified Pseudomonas TaxID=196821 RepID=UPI0035C23374